MQTNPNSRDVWSIADDKGASGVTGVNMTDSAILKPVIFYRGRNGMERYLTVDIYQVGEAKPHAIIYCPLCTDRDPLNAKNMSLTIRGENKEIWIDPHAYPKFPGISNMDLVQKLGLRSVKEMRGVISVEQFGCVWEEDPTLRRGFGFSCCNWKVKIDNNIARDV